MKTSNVQALNINSNNMSIEVDKLSCLNQIQGEFDLIFDRIQDKVLADRYRIGELLDEG